MYHTLAFHLGEYYQDEKGYYWKNHDLVRNWVILILAVLVFVAIITALSVFIYRRWRKNNCFPIYFAGKVRYAKHGESIQDACSVNSFGDSWLEMVKRAYIPQGKVVGLYTDSNFEIPLDTRQKVTAPLHIFPKIQK